MDLKDWQKLRSKINFLHLKYLAHLQNGCELHCESDWSHLLTPIFEVNIENFEINWELLSFLGLRRQKQAGFECSENRM